MVDKIFKHVFAVFETRRNERIIELMLQTGYLTLDYVLTRPQLAYVTRFLNAETEKSFGRIC